MNEDSSDKMILKIRKELDELLRDIKVSFTHFYMGARNHFGKFENFRKKKWIIHLVELDELFPKIRVRDLKTACGRCGAHAKFENNA